MRTRLAITSGLLALLFGAEIARADLGVLVADGVSGPHRVSVLVSPVPLRAGLSQWSVLVQDAAGGLVEDAEVELSFSRPDEAAQPLRRPAGAGAHPFYRSAQVELTAAPEWRVAVSVRGSPALVFDVGVRPGAGPWTTYWLAFLAPAAGIGLFGLHQFLALRRRRTRT